MEGSGISDLIDNLFAKSISKNAMIYFFNHNYPSDVHPSRVEELWRAGDIF